MSPKRTRTARAWGIALTVLHVAFFAAVCWVNREEPIGMLLILFVDYPIMLIYILTGGTGNDHVDLTLLLILGSMMWYYVGYGMVCLASRLRRKRDLGSCGQCGYDLTGNVSGRCPECGVDVL